MTILIVAFLVVVGVLWLLIRPDMTAITGGLATGVSGRKNTLIAVTLVAVGILAMYMFWDVIKAFPNMSGLEQITMLAGILFVVMAIYGVWLIYQKGDSVWPQRAAILVFVVIFGIGAATWTKGERWVSDPITQEAFDIRTGEPNYVGYLDSAGIWQRGSLDGDLLRPVDCRTLHPVVVQVTDKDGKVTPETQMLPVPHQGFDYATKGTCFSPAQSGVRMVPISDENVPILPDRRLFNTPADLKAEADAKQAKIDATNQRRADLLLQKEIARLNALKPTVAACTAREFAGFSNCLRVTVNSTDHPYTYLRSSVDYCPKADDGRRITAQRDGLSVVLSLNPKYNQASFHVFELSPGQTYKGDTCA